MSLNEFTVEDAALTWLKRMGYTVFHGPDIGAVETGLGHRPAIGCHLDGAQCFKQPA